MQGIYKVFDKSILIALLASINLMVMASVYAQDDHKKSGDANKKVQKSAKVAKASSKSVKGQVTDSGTPVIDSIQFTGNQEIPSDELTKIIPLKVHASMSETLFMQSIVKISQFYQQHQMKITITPVMGKVVNNHMNLNFIIHEPINS